MLVLSCAGDVTLLGIWSQVCLKFGKKQHPQEPKSFEDFEYYLQRPNVTSLHNFTLLQSRIRSEILHL